MWHQNQTEFLKIFLVITLVMQNMIDKYWKVCTLSIRMSEMCVYSMAWMFYLILLRCLSKSKWIIQWFTFETWQIRLQNENSYAEFVNGLIILYTVFFLGMCAFAFTKRSFLQCVILFTCLWKLFCLLLVSKLVLTQMFSWGIIPHL